jgi:hypothetical protein
MLITFSAVFVLFKIPFISHIIFRYRKGCKEDAMDAKGCSDYKNPCGLCVSFALMA